MSKPKILVIALKTLEDFFSLKTTVFYLIAMLIVPVLFSLILRSQNAMNFSNMTLEMQAIILTNLFLVFSFLWISGLPLVLFSIIKCSGFISGEDNKGTLLILVSKPVKRSEIILGKFLAFLLYIAIMQAAILLVVPYIWTLINGLDLYVFGKLLGAVIPVYLYSLFVAIIFGSIATALSSISRNTVRTVIVLVFVTILIFFGCALIRNNIGQVYGNYGLYNFDINYHLGNAFNYFTGDLKMAPTMQVVLGTFSGTYRLSGSLVDPDQAIMPPSLPEYNYFSSTYSIVLWLAIAIGLMLFGIAFFEKRPIY